MNPPISIGFESRNRRAATYHHPDLVVGDLTLSVLGYRRHGTKGLES